MMKILAQKQIWNEYGYDKMLEQFAKAGELKEVMIVPFTQALEPETDLEYEPDYVFGSGRLIDIARERGWHTFDSYAPIEWGILSDAELWVNGHGWESTVGKIDFRDREQVFVKPFHEKLFTGKLLEKSDVFSKKMEDVIQFSTSEVEDLEEQKIWVAPPSYLEQEYRFFVLDGKIITGSLYKEKGEAIYREVVAMDVIWQMTEELMEKFTRPVSASVDVTLIDGKCKLIELNNLNSAGIYACDVQALSHALLESLYLRA